MILPAASLVFPISVLKIMPVVMPSLPMALLLSTDGIRMNRHAEGCKGCQVFQFSRTGGTNSGLCRTGIRIKLSV